DVVEELRDGEAESILAEMESDEAAEIRGLMTYPWDTAAGRMTPEFVAIPESLSVAAAMRGIRAQAPDAETSYYIYVADDQNRLQGVVGLGDFIVVSPLQPIAEIMRRTVISLPAELDQEEAARVLTEHDLLALPVVDKDGQLIGVITADDVADVLEEEAT